MSLKIIYLIVFTNLPGANELMDPGYTDAQA